MRKREVSAPHWSDAGKSHEEIMAMVDRQLGYLKRWSGDTFEQKHGGGYAAERVFSGGDQLRYAISAEIAKQASAGLDRGLTPQQVWADIDIQAIVNEMLFEDYPRPGMSSLSDAARGPSQLSASRSTNSLNAAFRRYGARNE